jgi:2-C-methyl-D-erythritol 4-phosphate cytidylyltransferase
VKNAVVIVAGGSGVRMGGNVPKQYMDLQGKPLLIHTMEKFLSYDPAMKIILVLASGHRKFWDVISLSYPYVKNVEVAAGGLSRFESVKNGLQIIEDGVVVGIHDAVRPFVNHLTIKRCYATARKEGSAIPVIEMDESVRMIKSGGRSSQLDRSTLRRIQTPQVFQSALIKKAYQQQKDHNFTDDGSVYESVFGHVSLVEGNRENIKITTPVDLEFAKLLMDPGQ